MNKALKLFQLWFIPILFLAVAMLWAYGMGFVTGQEKGCEFAEEWLSHQEKHSVGYWTGFNEAVDLIRNQKSSIYYECSSENENAWQIDGGNYIERPSVQPNNYKFVTITRDKVLADFPLEELEWEVQRRHYNNLHLVWEDVDK